jgi:hypothetical protein
VTWGTGGNGDIPLGEEKRNYERAAVNEMGPLVLSSK